MDKKQTLEQIKKIIARYEALSEAEKKRMKEEEIKIKYIMPLFKALGWNFEQDVYPETDVSGKRVDFAFRLNNVTKFFVEAKKISTNLDKEDFAKQAISYSYHKSVPYAA